MGKAFGGVLNPHSNTFNIITHNFLAETYLSLNL